MTFSRRQRWLAALVVGVGLLLAWAGLRERKEPKLTITYLGRTNVAGGWAMWFAVTNVGTGTAIYNQTGSVELSKQQLVLAVPCKSKLRRFAPGTGDIIRAETPREWTGRLRFTCYYTRENLRTQLQDWQSRIGVPPARVDWLMAHLLMGVEFNDTAVSEWIGE